MIFKSMEIACVHFSVTSQIYRRFTGTRFASPGLLLLLLLLLVLPSPYTVNGRVDSYPMRSSDSSNLDCKRVQKTFVNKGLTINSISSRPMPGGNLAVCNLGTTCCTKEMEQQLVIRSAQTIRTSMAKQMRKSVTSITAERDAILAEGKKILKKSHNYLHKMYSKTYGYIYLSRKSIITDMYRKLNEYFEGRTENLGKHIDDFFMELQKTMLSMMDKESRNDKRLTNCLLSELSRTRPFDEVPEKLKTVLRRALVTTRTFVMVLSHMRDLVQQIFDRVQATLSRECINSLTRLNRCPLCAGMEMEPCPNFCKNVMRGCFYQLYDITPAWSKLIRQMNGLAKRMTGPLIIENTMNSLAIKVSEGIMNFQSNYANETRQRLKSICRTRQVRSAPLMPNKDRTRERSRKGRTRDGRGRTSFGWDYGKRQQEMAKLIRNIKDKILKPQMHIWTSLMTSRCHGRKARCWNGTAIASYDHKLVGNNRGAQVSNPEVAVDTSANDPVFAKAKKLMEKLAKSCERALANQEVDYIVPSPVSTTFPQSILRNSIEGSGATPDLPSRRNSIDSDTEGSGIGPKSPPRSTNGPAPVTRPAKQPVLPPIRKLPPDDDDRSRLNLRVQEGSGFSPTIPSSTRNAPNPTRKIHTPSTKPPRSQEWRPTKLEGSGSLDGSARPRVVEKIRPGPGPDEADGPDLPEMREGSGQFPNGLGSKQEHGGSLPERPVSKTKLSGPVPNSVWIPKSPDSLNGYQVRTENTKNMKPSNLAMISNRPCTYLMSMLACTVLYWLLTPTDG